MPKLVKINERVIQNVLMSRALSYFNHPLIVPNNSSVLGHEADLLSVTLAGLIHEYEIKISIEDYRRDFEKNKHFLMERKVAKHRIPNYFWFVTYGFAIEPPEYAGWIRIEKGPGSLYFKDEINAPRLHDEKISPKRVRRIGKSLSYRLLNAYKHRWPATYESPVDVYV